MADITLEQTHALLEKLAAYVMNEVATKREVQELRQRMDERFEQGDKRFEHIDRQLADIRGEIGLIRAEQRVFSQSFDLHHKRLEGSDSDYGRIRDADDKGRAKA